MLKITQLKQLQILLITLLFTYTINAQVGINTDTPAYQFQMLNSGNVGPNFMAEYNNSGLEGFSLGAINLDVTNPYSGLNGGTFYTGTAALVAGVRGISLSATGQGIGVIGISNSIDGVGVRGSRGVAGGLLGWGGVFYNDLGYTGFFGAASDERTKTNILSINNALETIDKLKPVTYNFDLEKYPNMGLNTEKEYGFIAQEVREVLPEIVRSKHLDTNATGTNSYDKPQQSMTQEFFVMDYTRIIPILTQGIKEQQSIIENQNKKIESLENKLANLEAKVNTLLKEKK